MLVRNKRTPQEIANVRHGDRAGGCRSRAIADQYRFVLVIDRQAGRGSRTPGSGQEAPRRKVYGSPSSFVQAAKIARPCGQTRLGSKNSSQGS